MTNKKTFRSGFVALVGRPNVGKSTLVNALAGQKVAIVTPKPQTTRTRLLAIVTRDDAQLVLVDTPGLTRGMDALRRAMQRAVHGAVAGADLILVVAEARGDQPGLSPEDQEVLATARQGGCPIVLAINKIDLLDRKETLLPWMETFSRETGIEAVVPISAKHEDGLDRLVGELVSRLPEGEPLFPADMVTDQAERVMCAELVREQILRQIREEVPHSTAVVIEDFSDGRDEQGGMCHLMGRIYVERESQKGILVGKGGRQIKAISEQSRKSIEELLGCRVFLRLTVHVERDWRETERGIARMGYGDEHKT